MQRGKTEAHGSSRASAALLLFFVGACNSPPAGDEIVANMLDAIGPARERESVRSLRTVAEGSGPTGLFVTSVTSIRPDSVYFHQETGLGTTEIWSTPDRTWGGSQDEAYAEFGPSVRAFVRDHEFHLLLLDIRDRFSAFTSAGEDAVNGEPCLRVTMTPATTASPSATATGEPAGDASVCVRREDWLPLELTLESPEAAGPIRIVFGDWRRVDGLRLFHSFRLHEGADDVYTYEYVEISASDFGQDIDIPAPALPEPPG